MKNNALSFMRQCRLLIELIWSPTVALNEFRFKTPYLCPLLLFSVTGIIIVSFNNSMILNFTQRTLSLNLDEPQIDQSLRFIERIQLLGLILSPGILLLKWTLVAALIFLVAQLVDGKMTYRQSFSLVAFTSIFPLLESCVVLTILKLKGSENLNSPLDFQPPIGMNLFFPETSLSWTTFLNNFNLFEVWYVVILVLGVSILNRHSRLKAAFVVVPVWLFLVSIQVAVATISVSLQN